jgi:TonB family protein
MVATTDDSFQLDDVQGRFTRGIVSAGCSIAFTLSIFYGISQIQKIHSIRAVTHYDDLRAVILPVDTPPPPSHPTETTLVTIGTPVQFEVAAQASPIKIQIAPLPVILADAAAPMAHPGVVARFELGAGVVRPELTNEPNHVFDTSDVDQEPAVNYRKIPEVAASIFQRLPRPHVTLLFIVTAEGKVKDPHLLKSSGDAEFDQIMLDMIVDWEFRPAVRKGKTVRCWIQQGVQITMGSQSRFQ